ncbi:hypothetical protein [Streptomyces sp. NPDC088785]|uniref:hypothetical protein n=1 Tax=Streptomyces sp. NPDC088785 TaxID=3365897 RepID=UPI003809EA13
MTHWTIAIEATGDDALVSAIAPDAIVHAFDAEVREPPHEVSSAYVVRSEVDWSASLQRGRRCTLCAGVVPLT